MSNGRPAKVRIFAAMKWLWGLLLVILLLPAIKTTQVGKPLVGQSRPEFPDLSRLGRDWCDGSWQEAVSGYLAQNFGWRNDFVRYRNLKDFTFFGELHAADVVAGKNDYFFEGSYLEAATGRSAKSIEHFEVFGEQLAMVDRYLSSLGTKLLVVMAPGKGSYFPEHWPQPYADLPPNPADEVNLLGILRARQIDYINFNQHFREIKDTVSYPLFPQQGIHWSTYGQLIAFDSVNHRLEQLTGQDLPELVIDGIEVSDEQRGDEADIFRGLNLPQAPSGYPLAYPNWRPDPTSTPAPKVLVIGDSFYWNLYFNLGYSQHFFNGGDFWYYFEQALRSGANVGNPKDFDLKAELSTYDAVVLVGTEPHYWDIGQGFIGHLADQLTNGEAIPLTEAEIAERIQLVYDNEEWLAYMKQKANDQGLPLDTMARRDVIFVLEQERRDARKKLLQKAKSGSK